MTINDQHKIDSKIIFRDKENQNLIDLLLQELSRNRMAWNMLRRMSKVTYYLRRQDDFFLKVKYYLRKVFRKDTLNYRGIDTFSVAYQRKSLDYLKWRIEKNNNLENLKTIEEILQTKSYKGIVVYPTTIPWEPLQRPQQLMRELAKLGYLCFYCDNYRQRLEITQIETNLYIVSGEQYLIYPLKQRPVIVLCTWMMNLPFVNMFNDYFGMTSLIV